MFIFPCKSGGFYYSSFYVSDLSYTIPPNVFLDFRAVFNLYIAIHPSHSQVFYAYLLSSFLFKASLEKNQSVTSGKLSYAENRPC